MQMFRLSIGQETGRESLISWRQLIRRISESCFEALRSSMAEDQDGVPVLLMRNAWEHGRFQQEWPAITFSAVRDRN
jgi:peptide subunit release factor RF-3